ncbi:hypothetical protein K8R03_03565 [Candidatus Kaiserbacteria bacterium]|nr:hypothetical protein [Candidatus Kaiserbacteria bacterium]
MQGDPTVAHGVWWAFSALLDIMFRWVPSTILVMTNASSYSSPNPIQTPVTQPVTTTDVVNFLQMASPETFDAVFHNWALFTAISIMFSLLLAVGAIYCMIRIWQVRQNEHARRKAAAHTVAAKDVPKTQLRWNRIREQIASEDERQWRLAILEADIMLNELLDLQGFRGETMADKMKQVSRTNFSTIGLAWEAHGVRNMIAHQGMMQPLDAREARRVIGMYEQVFKEFRFLE